MKASWTLALDLLRAPSKAVDRLQKDDAGLPPAFGIYAVYLATAVLFYSVKPADFPTPPEGPGGWPVEGGFFFWLKVFAWNPLFLAVGAYFTAAFARALQSGRLALRLPLAVLAVAVPAAWMSFYKAVPSWVFALGWLAYLGAALPLQRPMAGGVLRKLLALLMSVNAVAVAFLPVFILGVFFANDRLYLGAEIVMVFWTLGVSAFSLGRLFNLGTARAFAALFLATVVQVLFIFSLRLLGLIPAESLKALMTA